MHSQPTAATRMPVFHESLTARTSDPPFFGGMSKGQDNTSIKLLRFFFSEITVLAYFRQGRPPPFVSTRCRKISNFLELSLISWKAKRAFFLKGTPFFRSGEVPGWQRSFKSTPGGRATLDRERFGPEVDRKISGKSTKNSYSLSTAAEASAASSTIMRPMKSMK